VPKAGAAQRGTSVIPQTKRGPTARGSCLPIQPGVNNATLSPPPPKLTSCPLGEPSESLLAPDPSQGPGP